MPERIAELKRLAAEHAAGFVESGMVVGLGHGSTAIFALRRIAARLTHGELTGVLGIPCSSHVARDARAFGIPLTTLEEHPVIDITIDGADEVDPDLNVIKGGGGALLHEKIVAQASRREVIVVDGAKLSLALGTVWKVPVELLRFGLRSQLAYLESLGAEVTLREKPAGGLFETDEGNLIADCGFGPIPDPGALAELMGRRAGIVEHGLFIGLTTDLVVADLEGVRHVTRP